MLTGAPEQANVVAESAMRVLLVPEAVYESSLRELPDVELELQRLAIADLAPATRASRIAVNTAEAMAALRATGAATRRNPDYMARDFLTTQLRVDALAKLTFAGPLLSSLADSLAPGGVDYETARVTHLDELLLSEMDAGLDQVLILGAGYDSRPYRFADALRGVRVFEVDLPSASALKRRKATRLLGKAPEHVTYVPADFRRDDLPARLTTHGYDLGAATFVILSGVIPYLPPAAVARLFAFIGCHTSPRSSIAFDYVFRALVEGDDRFRGAPQIRKRLAAIGEPMRFGIERGGAGSFIAQFGLDLVSDLDSDALGARYGGRPYGFASIAHGRLAA